MSSLSGVSSILLANGSGTNHNVDFDEISEGENSGKWEDEGGIYMKGERPLLSPVSEGVDEDEDDGLVMYDVAEAGAPSVPDGGYGWVIVFASFMCNLIVDGIANCFGVFLPVYVSEFNVGKGSAAWAGSLLCGTYLCVGPIVSALVNKFGCRSVCIAGSIVAATGFALSSLAPSLNILLLTYGFVGGLGFGLIYLPSIVCVGYYFESKRAMATGIAVCGSGVGTIIFAPLASSLLGVMTWHSANLIFAGLILLCGIFGLLMKPLEVQIQVQDEEEDENDTQKTKPLLHRMAEDRRVAMERGSISGSSYFMVQLPDGTVEKRMKVPLNVDPGVHSSFHLDQLVQNSTLTPVPTLPTITEAKVVEAIAESPEEVPDGEEKEELSSSAKSAGIQIPKGRGARRNSEGFVSSSPSSNQGTPISSFKEREMARTPAKAIVGRKSIASIATSMPRNGSAPQFNYTKNMPKNVSVPVFNHSNQGQQRKYSFKAVPLGTTSPGIRNSKPNLQERRRSSIKNSVLSFVASKPKIAGDEENMWSKQELSDGLIFSSSMKSSTAEPRHIVRPMSRKDIFYAGSIVNLPDYQSQKSLHTYRQSVLNLPRTETQADAFDAEVGKPAQPSKCSCFGAGTGAFKSALAQMMDFSLLKNPVFLFICVSNIFGMLGFYVPLIYLIDAAVQTGVEKTQAAYLLSIIGITNTIGRVLSGVLSDLPQVNSLFLNNVCILVSGICIVGVPFCSTYVGYVVIAIVFGLFVSGYVSLTSIILVDLLGLDNLTNAFGLLILFRGGASIVGAPLAGALFDSFQNYDVPFWVAGCFFILSSLISFLVPCVAKWAPPKKILQPPVYSVGYLEDIQEIESDETDSASSPAPRMPLREGESSL